MTIECYQCQTINSKSRDFCSNCGKRIRTICIACDSVNLPTDKFCGKCGKDLFEINNFDNSTSIQIPNAERKQATVLFSDISGYSLISERFDPEEVREFTNRVFSEISKVLSKYDGQIDKYVGDAVMAVFGIPISHEDDAARALRAAIDINNSVEILSKEFEEKFQHPLLMHTGIHTGVVLTGNEEGESITEKISGETINIASRLTDLAQGGQIFVGKSTFLLTERFFEFQKMPLLTAKGLSEPLEVYKVLKVRSAPKPLLKLSGRNSALIGRETEMEILKSGVTRLKEGKFTVFAVSGGPGSGKSRLLQDFKGSLDPNEIQFFSAFAYSFAENIPYFIFKDLLSSIWEIEESDSLDDVALKVKENVTNLLGLKTELVPHIGRLFDVSYAASQEISPQLWKEKLFEGMFEILFAISKRKPTIFCFEDLHWSDSSSLELLQRILKGLNFPAIFIIVSRPNNLVLEKASSAILGNYLYEISLSSLSSSEILTMLRSLLGSEKLPIELSHFIKNKVEGNPFFLEEVVNAMIDTGSLVLKDGNWVLTKELNELKVPLTINGVIAARLDNLEREMKRVLQEASVIGRVFYYTVLKRITILKDRVDQDLEGLEHLDLIRTMTSEPEIEFIFKHALTQDTAYNSILLKERQAMHERIGIALEQIFSDRTPDIYETLALHFKMGRSLEKAIFYLIKSGEKSLERYALEDAHDYFNEAIEMLKARLHDDKKSGNILVDVIVKMVYVYYYRGEFGKMDALLSEHRSLADTVDDDHLRGMYYAWLGGLDYHRERTKDAYDNCQIALEIGRRKGDDLVIGYAAAWLTWICADLGLLDEAIIYGENARKLCDSFQSSHYLCQALGGLGYVYMIVGETDKVRSAGNDLLDFSNKYGNIRGLIISNWVLGDSYFAVGDYLSAESYYKKSMELSNDPFYSRVPKLSLGLTYVMFQKYDQAEEPLRDVLEFGLKNEVEVLSTPASVLLGIMLISKGELNKGISMLEQGQKTWLENGNRWRYLLSEQIYGELQLEIMGGDSDIRFTQIIKNLSFVFRNVMFAGRKSEIHFKRALEGSREIGAVTMVGEASLGLGKLYLRMGRQQEGKILIKDAIEIFEKTGAVHYLEKARDLMKTAEKTKVG